MEKGRYWDPFSAITQTDSHAWDRGRIGTRSGTCAEAPPLDRAVLLYAWNGHVTIGTDGKIRIMPCATVWLRLGCGRAEWQRLPRRGRPLGRYRSRNHHALAYLPAPGPAGLTHRGSYGSARLRAQRPQRPPPLLHLVTVRDLIYNGPVPLYVAVVAVHRGPRSTASTGTDIPVPL